MKIKTVKLLAVIALCLATYLPSLAQWPTTLRQDLPVSATPNVTSFIQKALPYPDGSIIVFYYRSDWPIGIVYSIIDRYGEFVFPQPQVLTSSTTYTYGGRFIPDDAGGIFALWKSSNLHAQRLDSLGNRLWGANGIQINDSSSDAYDICTDGQGGFYVAWISYSYPFDIWGQHINGTGQVLWEPNGRLLLQYPFSQNKPTITHDGHGGFYMVWEDYRYDPYGDLYRQHFDSEGNQLWTPGGVYTMDTYAYHFLLPDDAGGVILVAGGSFGDVFRFNASGQQLWHITHVARGDGVSVVKGEPGYLYVAFPAWTNGYYYDALYVQRISFSGHTFWPTFNSTVGLRLIVPQNHNMTVSPAIAYCYPYLYGALNPHIGVNHYKHEILVNRVDSCGQRSWGLQGLQISGGLWPSNYHFVIPDGEGGCAVVWGTDVGKYNVWAKHVNRDGTLGGPLPSELHPQTHTKNVSPNTILSVSMEMITYRMFRAGNVNLEIYDLMGRKVCSIDLGCKTVGQYSAPFLNVNLSSGVYFLKLTTGEQIQIKKIALLR